MDHTTLELEKRLQVVQDAIPQVKWRDKALAGLEVTLTTAGPYRGHIVDLLYGVTAGSDAPTKALYNMVREIGLVLDNGVKPQWDVREQREYWRSVVRKMSALYNRYGIEQRVPFPPPPDYKPAEPNTYSPL
jgi:hypothetical protein